MNTLAAFWNQSYPPKPTFTEKELLDQAGKVFIVTGGASGVGHELVKPLYQANGTIYIAGCSQSSAETAISGCKSAHPSSKGHLEFLALDLSDLSGIRKSAEEFLGREERLDVLWNNAGVMVPPRGSKTKQVCCEVASLYAGEKLGPMTNVEAVRAKGYELQLGTNCLGPFLFTQCLVPILKTTAAKSPPASVRVVWTGSIVVDLQAPAGGFEIENLGKDFGDQAKHYALTKTANWFLGSEMARRCKEDAFLSLTQNPGNLKSPLQRHMPRMQKLVLMSLLLLFSPLQPRSVISTQQQNAMLHDVKFGGYTDLFAGLSPTITQEHNGAYIVPWGRLHPSPRKDLLNRMKPVQEGGTGMASEFWEWCEEQTREYR